MRRGRNAAAMMLVAFLFLGDVMFLSQANAANTKYGCETSEPNGHDVSQSQAGRPAVSFEQEVMVVPQIVPDAWESSHRLRQPYQGLVIASSMPVGCLCSVTVSSAMTVLPNMREPSQLNTSRCSNCSITLKWNAPSVSTGLTGYLVQVSDTDSFETILRNLTVTSSYNSITVSELSDDAEYYFRVQGLFNGTGGQFSAAVHSGPVAIQDENMIDTNLMMGTALVIAILALFDFMTLYTKMKGKLHH